MKKHKSLFAFLLLFSLLLTFLTCAVQAQTNGAAGPATAAAPLDAKALLNSLLVVLIPMVATIIVWAGKQAVPRLPTWLLPILAPAIGALVNWLSALAGGPNVNPLVAAVLGSAGVGFREVFDQVGKRMNGGGAAAANLLLLCAGLSFALGCATRFIDKVAQTRAAAVHASYRATAEFNTWLQPRTNNPANYGTTYAALMAKWTNVDTAARQVGQTALLAEAAEDAYRNAPTNEVALAAALKALSLQASNVTALVTSFTR